MKKTSKPASSGKLKRQPKQKPLTIQMSTQAKMFLTTLDPKVRDGFLDFIEKLASGKIKGKRINMSELAPEDRQAIETSSREFIGKKPISA